MKSNENMSLKDMSNLKNSFVRQEEVKEEKTEDRPLGIEGLFAQMGLGVAESPAANGVQDYNSVLNDAMSAAPQAEPKSVFEDMEDEPSETDFVEDLVNPSKPAVAEQVENVVTEPRSFDGFPGVPEPASYRRPSAPVPSPAPTLSPSVYERSAGSLGMSFMLSKSGDSVQLAITKNGQETSTLSVPENAAEFAEGHKVMLEMGGLKIFAGCVRKQLHMELRMDNYSVSSIYENGRVEMNAEGIKMTAFDQCSIKTGKCVLKAFKNGIMMEV